MWALISIAASVDFGCVQQQCAGALQRCKADAGCSTCYNKRVWGLDVECLKELDSIYADELLKCGVSLCEKPPANDGLDFTCIESRCSVAMELCREDDACKPCLQYYGWLNMWNMECLKELDSIFADKLLKCAAQCEEPPANDGLVDFTCVESRCPVALERCQKDAACKPCLQFYGWLNVECLKEQDSIAADKLLKCAAQCEQPQEHSNSKRCGPHMKGICPGDQMCLWGEHAGCEEGTCRHPHPVCMVRVTNYHCACPGYEWDALAGGELFDEGRQKCVPAAECGHDLFV